MASSPVMSEEDPPLADAPFFRVTATISTSEPLSSSLVKTMTSAWKEEDDLDDVFILSAAKVSGGKPSL